MKVLVTGANGFLGSHVVDRLLQSGHEINALVRPASPSRPWDSRVRVFRTDLRAPQNLPDALTGVEAVVHLAAAVDGSEDAQFASTVVGTENLLSAMAKSGVPRLVHISSLVVYDWSKARQTMDETTPLEADIYSMGGYAIAKFWQERLVWRFSKSHGCELTVLRPGFIWGKDHMEIAGMGRRIWKFRLVIGPTSHLPLTHVENCADSVVFALESPNSSGEAFNIVDSAEISAWRYVGEYIRRTGRRQVRIPIPYMMGSMLARCATGFSRWQFGKKGKLPSLLSSRRFESQFKPLRFSTAKAREVMGWSSSLDFDNCLERSCARSDSEPFRG